MKIAAAYLPQLVGAGSQSTLVMRGEQDLLAKLTLGQIIKARVLRVYESQRYLMSFQGQERDIVYISMTRSNPDNRIGFLSDIRRMNVAMTRARKKLVVIGDSATLSQFDFYNNFISWAQDRNAYQSAWEFAE